MEQLLQPVASWLPEGRSGRVVVERFTVSKEDAAFDSIRSGRRCVLPGTYTRLMVGDHLMMSDTPAELSDHWKPADKARGRVLIHGLGLGCIADACLRKPEVEHVTVVDLSPDVIALVAPPLIARHGAERATVIQGDAYTYKPAPTRFAVVWHDIWPSLCTDNLEGMARLHRRFARRADWQGSWGKELLRYRRSQERRMGW